MAPTALIRIKGTKFRPLYTPSGMIESMEMSVKLSTPRSRLKRENAKMTGLAAKKMGIKDGARAILVNAPAEAVEAIDPSGFDVSSKLTGMFDYIHLFTKSQENFNQMFPRLKAHLKPTGILWVSWPKNRKLGTDLTLTKVIELGYNHGLVESKTISINETWSAIKFTHPKQGKVYKNSYGKLKT
jgi:hypothetical protein